MLFTVFDIHYPLFYVIPGPMPKTGDKQKQMRLDKWLWCARFFKTRGLAADAIKSGKVLINDKRVKPARTIVPGDHLLVRRGAFQYALTIRELCHARKPASEAVLLYEESPDSIHQREIMAEQIRVDRMAGPQPRGRPTKRERRELIRFKNRG